MRDEQSACRDDDGPLRLKAVVRPAVEPATVTWFGGTGLWSDPAKWDVGRVPGRSGAVVIASGTCQASNWVLAASVALSGSASLRIGYTCSDLVKEVGGLVTGNVTLSGSSRLDVAQRNLVRRGDLTVGGDLTLGDTAKLYVAAGPTNGTTRMLATGAGFLRVGGTFALNGSSLFVPSCEPWKGGCVMTTAGTFTLGSSASVEAVSLGYARFKDLVPESYAPGRGWTYNRSGGYGGRGGDSGQGGATYGFANAPVHPGSHKAYYQGGVSDYNPNGETAGGGYVRIHAGRVELAGKIDVQSAMPNTLGGASGGGIWITAARKLKVRPTTKLLANTYQSSLGYGGGGRIAFGLRLKETEIATLAATGALPDGSSVAVLEQDAFVAEYPGVTVNLNGNPSYAAEKGTFRYLVGPKPGLVILLK